MQPDCFTFAAVIKACVVAGDAQGHMPVVIQVRCLLQLKVQAQSGTSFS